MAGLQYRSNFLVEFVTGAGTAALGLFPLIFVYDHAETVGGWTFPEALLVTAFFLFLTSLVGTLVEPNLSAVVDGVRTGQLDYLLIKPVDSQLLASVQKVAPARVWEGVAAVAVAVWAFSRLGPPSPWGVLAALGLLLAGLAAMYSLWIGVICMSFWFVRVDNLRFLLSAIADAGRWPVSIYKGWLRIALTVLVPVALTTSYPAMALLGRMDGSMAAGAVGIAVVALGLSRLAWRSALRHYTSASS